MSAVAALIVLNVATFVVEVRVPDMGAIVDRFALIPYDLLHGVQLPPPSAPLYATPLTALFLHANLWHLSFNVLFLLAFGPHVAERCGPVRFVAFYLLCGVAGNLAHALVFPASHLPVIGASGAIAGVLGAYLMAYPTAGIRAVLPLDFLPRFIDVPAALLILAWALAQFAWGYGTATAGDASGGGTAYFGHVGGFIAGVLTIGAFARRKAGRRPYKYTPKA